MAKKKSSENKSVLNKYIVFIAPVITFILGWLAYIGYSAYDSHINRPILSFKIKTLTINETLNGASSLRIILNQENTGESEAMYTIKECKVLFPLIDEKPLKILVNKNLTLSPRTIRIDTVRIPLTFALDQNNLIKFDSLSRLEMVIEETRLKKTFLTERDASEIVLKGGMSNGGPAKYSGPYYFGAFNKKTWKVEVLDPNLVQYLKKNPKTGQMLLVRGRHYILYNGINYENSFFPNTAKVAHEIKDDKIFIECSLDLDTTGKHVPGFYFIPDERIKYKIVLPKYYSLFGSLEYDNEDETLYNNLRMDLEFNDYGVVLFFLFQE